MPFQWPSLRRITARNASTLRTSALAEISGSLGDLGTLLPLLIALAAQGSVRLDATLVFSGLFNVLTGVVYGVPLPVQPMKAIASAAIARPRGADMAVVMAAGQWVGVAVLLLSVTGLIRVVTRLVPITVVYGIQLGAGLSLVAGAGSSLLLPLTWVHPALDNRVWAFAAFVALLVTQRRSRVPYALVLFILGLVLAIIRVFASGEHHLPDFRFWRPHFLLPNWLGDEQSALWMAIGQLPLTTLNSVIAVSALSAELLPEVAAPSVSSLGVSVGLMNLIGTWFGAMPVCHGSGGLAGQYRFGARSGASVIILGLFKMVIGLVFGETLVDLLGKFPGSLLGVMVIAAGLELAKAGSRLNSSAPDLLEGSSGGGYDDLRNPRRHRLPSAEERTERWTVMLMTTAGILASKNTAVGFLAGMLCHWSYLISARLEKGREAPSTERGPLLE